MHSFEFYIIVSFENICGYLQRRIISLKTELKGMIFSKLYDIGKKKMEIWNDPFSLNCTFFVFSIIFLSFLYLSWWPRLGKQKHCSKSHIPPTLTQKSLIRVKYVLEVSAYPLWSITHRILFLSDNFIIKRIVVVFETKWQRVFMSIPDLFYRRKLLSVD